jgi:large subunit ribosomal protein L10e
MSRKPASMYKEIKQRSFTRREYIGGVPSSKISQFEMGNPKREFPSVLTLHVENSCQIRHNALEAARITANRLLEKNCGKQNYFLKIFLYPHEVLRENKQATGAGADRISKGMKKSFGKNVGTAARVKSGQKIMSVFTTENNIKFAKLALHRASIKLPTHGEIRIEEIKQESS